MFGIMNTGKNGKDLPIYRYPEILLIAAEAIAESEGVTSEAIGYLADVRARAYTKMDRAAIVASLAGLSKEDFIHEVWNASVSSSLRTRFGQISSVHASIRKHLKLIEVKLLIEM